MAGTEGTARLSDDPALNDALNELSAEGVDLNAPASDLEPDAVSQPEPTSAEDSAATPPAGALGAETAPVVPVDDPFAGTEPFKYGDGKVLDGVYRVPGEGLLVPEDRVPVIQQLAERAETLDRVAREYQTANQQFERIAQWTRTNEDGSKDVLTGIAAIAEERLHNAQLAVEHKAMYDLLNDPVAMHALLLEGPEGKAVYNQERLEAFVLRAQMAAGKAQEAVRKDFGARFQSPQAPSAPDYTTQAPSIIDAALKQSGLVNATLTPESKALLASQLGQHIRTVTENDRLGNPALKVGAPIVSESFTALVKHLAQSQATQKTALSATEKATAHNAGMTRGRAQPARPAKAAPVAPASTQKPTKSAAWDDPFKEAMNELNIPYR